LASEHRIEDEFIKAATLAVSPGHRPLNEAGLSATRRNAPPARGRSRRLRTALIYVALTATVAIMIVAALLH
jgi:hypothetical protein